jgi:uncharacterized membrane protein
MEMKILLVASTSLIVGGTIVSYLAFFQREDGKLQWFAGAMLVAGLILVGIGLSHALGASNPGCVDPAP